MILNLIVMDSSDFSLGFNTVELNWILLTVAIIVVYMLGALWYSPILFGDKWAAIINPKFTKPNTEKISFLPMIFQFVATIILGVVVFVGVQISIPLTISMLVAAAGWQKAALFFKYPQFDNFVKVAFIEVGYFTIASTLFVIIGLM